MKRLVKTLLYENLGANGLPKVFLGGTCNNSTWREDLIEKLDIDFFNPVVDDWTEDDYKEELHQREICDYLLYVITPKMKGVYSIAEIIDDSNKRPYKTIFCYLLNDENEKFDKDQIKSLDAVGKMVEINGGKFLKNLDEIAKYLNTERKKSKLELFKTNIEDDTLSNFNYRKVIKTTKNLQLVLMTLKPGEEIGEETHENDQFFRFESGVGKCIVGNIEHDLKDGDAIIIPMNTLHNIINTGDDDLKLYTIYSPPHHPNNLI